RDEKHPRPRTALCISGGGIRSATFALGVIQGLASAKVLDKFDYLSTVSGGGYIGSWLSSWVRRHHRGVSGVQEDLQRGDTAFDESRAAIANDIVPVTQKREVPEQKVKPEPKPVGHLREYSNYLSPRLGIFSGDSWTLASTYVRNLLLNLLVLVPLLALALAFPRIFSWLLEISEGKWPPSTWAWIFAGLTTLGFAYLGWKRPVDQGQKAQKANRTATSDISFLIGCVLPLAGAATALAVFWARIQGRIEQSLSVSSTQFAAGAAILGMTLVPYLLYYGRYWRRLPAARREGFEAAAQRRKVLLRKQLGELFAVTVALLVAGALILLLALKVFDDPLRPAPISEVKSPIERVTEATSPQAQLYVCLIVPLLLLVFFVQASIFVGLSSRRNEDYDREWWGRAGAWLIAMAVLLGVFNVIAVFGPIAFYYAPAILASIGGVAGAGAALFGYSDKSSANQKQNESTAEKSGNLASALLVPVFIATLLAAISLGTTWLIQQFHDEAPGTAPVAKKILDPADFKREAMLNARYAEAPKPVVNGVQTLSTASAPLVSIPAIKATAHLQTVQQTSLAQWLIILGVGIFGVVLSLFIGVNKFSMQALYRNRIIRAYLGASREDRDADGFTGFDEHDNLQMWELRPELLWPTNVSDVPALVTALRDPNDQLGSWLWSRLDKATKSALETKIDGVSTQALVQNLNAILLHDDLSASGVQPPAWTQTGAAQIAYSRPLLNRATLDENFAACVESMAPPADAASAPKPDGVRRAPLHVVNTALNLTSGENLAWQQRKAESFSVSPYHSGSLFLGYRSSREYGGGQGISLGTAVAISGAAASPNMGYHSSATVAFLLTFFNVRLGAWLGNPGPRGRKSYTQAHPTTGLVPLIQELTGNSDSRSPWVYLSDGGHFENLALYEMVVRRCHTIVVSDAGADPKCAFEDLGNAIRKIRTDLGVPIDLKDIDMAPRAADGQPVSGKYVAFGTIRYSAVDKGAPDGLLIYIKPGVYKSDYFPRDVYNYALDSRDFPHESTGDQFFSESQFESYRPLGRHAIDVICRNA
ncbi:MAG TPA: patatin-like phospholipase family protein, partial [Thermoanaerobaculia bacterium]|nr:patatin-like phospholipase family protein [Thermoanaerobaculia bacterium]